MSETKKVSIYITQDSSEVEIIKLKQYILIIVAHSDYIQYEYQPKSYIISEDLITNSDSDNLTRLECWGDICSVLHNKIITNSIKLQSDHVIPDYIHINRILTFRK